ncbi:putative 3-deoxy-7-phosphoheptulonate synthase [Helianthus anomalus]
MHGNTIKVPSGFKTRPFDSLLVSIFFSIFIISGLVISFLWTKCFHLLKTNFGFKWNTSKIKPIFYFYGFSQWKFFLLYSDINHKFSL